MKDNDAQIVIVVLLVLAALVSAALFKIIFWVSALLKLWGLI